MTELGTVLFFVPLCSQWDRLNGKLLSAQDRKNFKLIAQKGSISGQLRRQVVDEVMTKLDTVLCFVPLCSTWGQPNGKILAARDRNNIKPVVQSGSIRWRLRRQGVDELVGELNFSQSCRSNRRSSPA